MVLPHTSSLVASNVNAKLQVASEITVTHFGRTSRLDEMVGLISRTYPRPQIRDVSKRRVHPVCRHYG